MNAHTSARNTLAECLHSDANFIGLYYLTPFANLLQIFESGGIRPRNLINQPALECSGYTVQSRRTRAIPLMNDHGHKIEVKIHDCINFFLNPINYTLYQFRRNARLAATKADKPAHMGALIMVELDLVRLLRNSNLAWGISDCNIASGGCLPVTNKDRYQEFDWNRIYSIQERNDFDNYNWV